MVTYSPKDYSSFTSSTRLTSLHVETGVPIRKIHQKIKFTWLLFRLHESMNKNLNSCKAATLFKK